MAGSPGADYEVAGTPPLYDEQQHDEKPPQQPGIKGFIKRYYLGVPGVLTGAILGIIVGIAVQTANPSEVVTSWIGILGTLFINAVSCLVAPLVFCSLVVGMADMLAVGKAGKIGSSAALMYVITTVCASIEGLIWVVIFRPVFSNEKRPETDESAKFAFQCSEEDEYLTNVNGTVECVVDEKFKSDGNHSNSSIFMVKDINGYFAEAESEYAERTLTEALQSQLKTLVPSNITAAFAEANLLSIIAFAVPFGVAISLLPEDMKLLANFFQEVNEVFMKIIQWVIACTPVALISLLAETIAEQEDLKILVTDVAAFVGASIVGMVFHMWVVYPTLVFAFTRINPYKYMSNIFPAQVFAVSCASSMATLPVTMRCVDSTKQVSKTVSRFVLSLGATINMDGSGICYPIAVVFMAEAAGMGYLVGNVEYFLIILVSTLGAIGAGPVPSASIVITMTVWTSVFSSVPLPPSFTFIVATDWLLDRFATATNITGDTCISRIVAHWVGETEFTEEDRESMNSALTRVSNRYSHRHNGASYKDTVNEDGSLKQ